MKITMKQQKMLRKEKIVISVFKTAIICATIVAVVYLIINSGDDKKNDKDQKGEE